MFRFEQKARLLQVRVTLKNQLLIFVISEVVGNYFHLCGDLNNFLALLELSGRNII